MLVDQFRLGNLLPQDMALDEVRQPHSGFVLQVLRRRDGEDLVQLFQGQLLGLADEAEDHDPRNEIKASIETESTDSSHDGGHAGEGETKNTGERVVDADSPSHALLTLDGGENLGGVLESHGAFA